jgi:hypothetical protein
VADSLETWDWWRRHGDMMWTHPGSPIGDNNRDIRKMRHYTQDWPALFAAAQIVAVQCMGWPLEVVEEVFRDAKPESADAEAGQPAAD